MNKTLVNRVKFLFDLNGYIIVRNVLSASEVKAANDAISEHKFEERDQKHLRNTKDGTVYSGDGTTGRLDMGGMLGWNK